jgi:hypothetical protein
MRVFKVQEEFVRMIESLGGCLKFFLNLFIKKKKLFHSDQPIDMRTCSFGAVGGVWLEL